MGPGAAEWAATSPTAQEQPPVTMSNQTASADALQRYSTHNNTLRDAQTGAQTMLTFGGNADPNIASTSQGPPPAAAEALNPPWLTTYDHDHTDASYDSDYDDDLMTEAETDSGADHSWSDNAEQYATDSDTDGPWYISDASNSEDDGQPYHNSDDVANGSAADDWPATDVEQYNEEAAAEAAAARHSMDSDENEQAESDPDTEDEAAEQQLERPVQQSSSPMANKHGCLPACFASLCRTASPPAESPLPSAAAGSSRSAAASATAAAPVAAADAAALREIRHYQATVHSLIAPEGFEQMVQGVMSEYSSYGYRTISDRAIKALQAAAEDYLICLFRDANTVAIDAGRQKIYPEDIGTASKIRNGRNRVKRVRRVTVEEEYYCFE